jgi:hypothetical protein
LQTFFDVFVWTRKSTHTTKNDTHTTTTARREIDAERGHVIYYRLPAVFYNL